MASSKAWRGEWVRLLAGRLALVGAARAYHARRAPDVGWGPVLSADQHLHGPVLPRLDVLSEVLVLEASGALGRSGGPSGPAPSGPPVVSYFLWVMHPSS